MSKLDGGSAFPSLDIYESYNSEREQYEVKSDTETGMSLRDWFAGQSLKGAADSICDNLTDLDGNLDQTLAQATKHAERHAKAAYLLADAMLAEGAKGQG